MFEDQKAATMITSIGGVSRWKNPATTLKFNWGVSPLPKGKIVFTHTSGDAPIVWAKSKQPTEAAAVLAFMTSDAHRISWHKVRGQAPSRLSLYDKLGYDHPGEKLALAITKDHGYAPPITPGYLEYFSAINAAVKDIALGANVEDRLRAVAKEIDGHLATYKK
jgi:multiple sugar transport system substrate-binding protein